MGTRPDVISWKCLSDLWNCFLLMAVGEIRELLFLRTKAVFRSLDIDTAGGWGPWSEWTPCSSTCADGTKNRYRFCDSPPPRYGAKFCEVCMFPMQYVNKIFHFNSNFNSIVCLNF